MFHECSKWNCFWNLKQTNNMNKKVLIIASVLGVLAVILGAFAAHGLENKVTTDDIDTFQTGVRYQMYHALLLLFVANTQYINIVAKKRILYLCINQLLYLSLKHPCHY